MGDMVISSTNIYSWSNTDKGTYKSLYADSVKFRVVVNHALKFRLVIK